MTLTCDLFCFFPSSFRPVPANVTPLVASPVIGIEGNSATLSFSITDADPPVKTENIRWERLTPVNEIIDITDSDSEHFQFAKDRLSLTIVQLTDGQVGLYTLFATNEAGTRFNSIALVLEGEQREATVPCCHIQ